MISREEVIAQIKDYYSDKTNEWKSSTRCVKALGISGYSPAEEANLFKDALGEERSKIVVTRSRERDDSFLNEINEKLLKLYDFIDSTEYDGPVDQTLWETAQKRYPEMKVSKTVINSMFIESGLKPRGNSARGMKYSVPILLDYFADFIKTGQSTFRELESYSIQRSGKAMNKTISNRLGLGNYYLAKQRVLDYLDRGEDVGVVGVVTYEEWKAGK